MKSITRRAFGVFESHGHILAAILSLAGLGMALFVLVRPPPPSPPRPFAHLVCTTDGMPDLEVACSTSKSTNFRAGTIIFEYGDQREIETITEQPPTKGVKRLWNRVWHQSETQLDSTVTALKETYRKRYEKAGVYNIELILEGAVDGDFASTSRTITVDESPDLRRGAVEIEDLYLYFDNESPTYEFDYRIDQAQHDHRLFFDTTRKYTRTIKANKGWKIIECMLAPSLRYRRAYYERSAMNQFSYSNDRSEAIFTFRLTSKRWFLDGRSGWFHGTVTCSQTPPTDPSKEEQSGGKDKLIIERTGVIETTLDQGAGTLDVESIRTWSFKHKGGKPYDSTPGDPLKSAKLPHGVEVSFVNPPRLIERDERPSTVWLRVRQE